MSGKSGHGGRPPKSPRERRRAAKDRPKIEHPLTHRQPASPPNFDAWLDRQLHEMFDSISAEPLPADLVALINQPGSKKPG